MFIKIYQKVLLLCVLLLLSSWGISKNIQASKKENSSKFFAKVLNGHIKSSDDITWKQVGPGSGGTAMGVFIHPTKKIAFMCNDMGCSYRSLDGGLSWESIVDYDGNGIAGTQFESMVFSLKEPQKGFATCNRGLYKTEDYGKSWKKVKYNFKQISSVAINPKNNNIMLVGSGRKYNTSLIRPNMNTGKIYRSIDAGKTWEKTSQGIAKDAVIMKIVFSADNNKIFAATTNGFYISHNGGDSWTRSEKNLVHSNCRGLDYSFNKKTKKMILFLLLWTDIKIEKNVPVYSGGLYKSTDSGKTWGKIESNDLYFNLNKMSEFVIAYFRKMLARTFKISLREANKIKLPSKAYQRFSDIIVYKKNPNIMYLGTLGFNNRHSFVPFGLWKSINGGKTWDMTTRRGKGWKNPEWLKGESLSENVDSGWLINKKSITGTKYNQLDTRSIAVFPVDFKLIYFSTVHAVYKSANGGKTWKNVDVIKVGLNKWKGNGNSNVVAYDTYIDPRTPNNILLGAMDICLLKTSDGGKTFSPTSLLYGDGGAVAFDPSNPRIVYVGEARGSTGVLYISNDGGNKFKKRGILPNRAPITEILIDRNSPQNNRRIIACSSSSYKTASSRAAGSKGNGIFVSEDSGKTWKRSNNGLEKNLNIINIKQHPNKNNIIYAAAVMRKHPNGTLEKGGIFKSCDTGRTWRKVKIPKDVYNINSIHIDETNPDTIYFAAGQILDFPFNDHTRSGGIFRSIDAGKTWEKIFSSTLCSFVISNPQNPNIIYISNSDMFGQGTTNNPGVFRSFDFGQTWEKVNKGIANPHMIVTIRFHPIDPSVIWLASNSSGWYVNKYKIFK